MRPILPPGGRGRKALAQLGRLLPSSARSWVSDSIARWDYRREELQITREIEQSETDSGPADGIPVPPPLLRVRVTGAHAERAPWLTEGATDAGLIRDMLRRNGSPIDGMDAILDFGCGCGRVARHWARLEGPEIHGADVSRRGVRWCRRNLRFMRTVRSGPEPPLPYPDRRFDLVYALSVLTHLTEESGRRWLVELLRILNPGGLLLFTVHGERFAHQLTAGDRERFTAGEFVVVERPEALAGTNAYAAFHPPRYVQQRLLPPLGVDLVEEVHLDPIGDGLTPMPVQDNYLVRKEADPS